MTTASFQLLFGKFYTFFSIKWVYLIAIGIFELGSLVCGVAPNSIALIVGRAIAGVGSAGIFSGALIIIAYSVPLVKRPMYSGCIGAMYGIASVTGPLLGGAFTDKGTSPFCGSESQQLTPCSNLEMVLLHQLAYRWHHHPRHHDLLQVA